MRKVEKKPILPLKGLRSWSQIFLDLSVQIELNTKGLMNVCLRIILGGYPGGAVVESLPADAGDTGSSPGLGRSHMPRSN